MKKLTFDNICKKLKKESKFQDVANGLDILVTGVLFFMGHNCPVADIGEFVNALAVKD